VPITPKLQEVLSELRAEQKQAKVVNLSGRVFTKTNGQPIASIRKPFEAACRLANIEDLRLHDFRHTCITRWATEGKPVGVIMAASGHHSLEMHTRYVNVGEHHLRKAFSVLTTCLQEKSVDAAQSTSY
ncbi:MAG: tyrosine-type recombinase/integrase, partial [Methylococcales bacterium]